MAQYCQAAEVDKGIAGALKPHWTGKQFSFILLEHFWKQSYT